ncbi:chromate transporter [Pueribacillus theae]|uniref:Chromate transporter n=1 Tax=Pueribacillus theae TaxID=2171751 RepID=A0A2U1K029_9BACI|nr:chromate transporter [Pueribacillus theae]PWA10378.1 chromate transporter [Pueribacillus theae]
MEMKLKTLYKLFFTFLKVSPITFGGGYAMLPLIEREVVKRRKWLNEHEVVDILTVAQTAPGAVAINSAIFIGYRVAGLLGSIVALFGIMLPNLLIVIIAIFMYFAFRDNPIIEAVFNGLASAVIALIVYAAYMIGRTAISDLTTIVIALISFIILIFLNVNPVLLILGGGFVGLIFSKLKVTRKEKRKNRRRNVS